MINKVLCLLLCLIYTSCISSGVFAERPPGNIPVRIDNVRIILLQSYPVRVQIIVRGEKAEDRELTIKQQREDRTITITISQANLNKTIPRIVTFEEHVFLNGGFTKGEYSLRVNNFATSFEIQ